MLKGALTAISPNVRSDQSFAQSDPEASKFSRDLRRRGFQSASRQSAAILSQRDGFEWRARAGPPPAWAEKLPAQWFGSNLWIFAPQGG